MSIPQPSGRTALVLIGHGAPATDCPPEWIGELMSLTWSPAGKPAASLTTPHAGRHPAPPDKSGAPPAGWHGDGEAHHAAPHGRAPLETPPLTGRAALLRQGFAAAAASKRAARRRAAELDAKIRRWPRHAGNDPYKTGLEQLAAALRPMVRTELFAIGYNEFCRPSIGEAIDEVIRQGATRVLIVPSMLTPGGVHAEHDIPLALDAVRRAHPDVVLEYVWPFDLAQVAALLAAHVRAKLEPDGANSQMEAGSSP